MDLQKIIDGAKPDKPDTCQMSFVCPVELKERFNSLAQEVGADRTRLLVGVVAAVADEMQKETRAARIG
jgi:predicted DNA-binding protein